jgi:uncharacterized protein
MKQDGVFVVTGASSGIGAVYADRLAARGHDLIVVARREARLAALAAQIRQRHGRDVRILAADLADNDDLKRVQQSIRDTGNLAGIVNAAGLGALGLSASIDPSALESMIKVNILALTQLSMAAAHQLRAAGRGAIINVGSIVALMPVPGAGGYSGSKAYVLNFTRALHAELSPSGIVAQAVMPGPVRTEFGDTPAPFPDALFMTPEALVDAALHALDHGETICFPTLHALDAWQHFESARGLLVKAVTQSGLPAARYRQT